MNSTLHYFRCTDESTFVSFEANARDLGTDMLVATYFQGDLSCFG